MHFQSTTLILAFAMATGLMASPLKEKATNELVELFREDGSDGGQLIYFGHGDNTGTETEALQDRASCSSTAKINCHSKHAARNEVCDKLVTHLQGYSDVAVAGSPRQICYKGESEDDEYCCVSWHNTIPGLTKGDLATYAENIFKQCTSNGISGKTEKVLVHSTCTNVCMSNRGTHC
ncbi:uncharacterized protein N7498_008740 [Penicillium cinerascens]|uniref:WD-like domain-containing protein n=1 Tax=Penicillium cinerascens TaxID=70096 RepID=A0A9W9JFG5_9EURO|nr:uncharacterized protein N7498_008740 [Penicillium cinerascens]KAJ5195302.1 hypothetical protein N7498_008740 [Penicillium cinerascens]